MLAFARGHKTADRSCRSFVVLIIADTVDLLGSLAAHEPFALASYSSGRAGTKENGPPQARSSERIPMSFYKERWGKDVPHMNVARRETFILTFPFTVNTEL